MRWFEAPGLTGESFYRTRRSDLRATMTVLFGIGGALYAGVDQVTRLVHGVGALEPAFGLSEYQFEIIKAAGLGAVVGALLSWPLGSAWERWHRARRSKTN